MEEIILGILKDVFNLETVDNTCSKETCEQWDSIGLLNLVIELESEFDISIEPEEIGKMKSFTDIVSIVKGKLGSRDIINGR